MIMDIPLLSIRIGIDPDMFEIGTFVLTWHGFLTFVSVAIAVTLAFRWGRKEGLLTDSVYSVAVWGIIGGIIGARAVHVIDFWDSFYSQDPVRIVEIWNGGIAIFGCILGGFLGGAGYIAVRNHPRIIATWNRLFRGAKLEKAPLPSIGHAADIAAPAYLIGLAIGRIGDIINGEHFAKLTDLPWGFIYTHPKTQALYIGNELNAFTPTHPAVAYEMLMDLVILAMIWPLRDRLRPHGMVFALFLVLYSLGRFFLSFLRLDRDWAIGLNEAQFIALIVLAVTVPLLVFKAKFVRPAPAARPRSARARGR